MVGINDLFPKGASVSKEQLRKHLPGPVANVQGFGAKGNGKADDTLAIQAAIDWTVSQGGGTVYLPAGIYKIMPQRSAESLETNALSIRGDNVRILGDGPSVTKLVFRVAGDRDPSNSFDIVNRAGQSSIWRGSAIAIDNSAGAGRTLRDVTIEDIEIDGGANPGNTKDQGQPSLTNGDGWDVSHKGILIVPDLAYRGLNFINLHLHNFRGEIIYGGGYAIDDVVIERCNIHSTNGDGVSISASLVMRDNRIGDCAHACVENFHGSKEASYTNNSLSNARLGLNFQTNWDSPHVALVSGNIIEECSDNGILMNIENGPTLITGNMLVDCGYPAVGNAAIRVSPANGVRAPVASGIVIKNNSILRQIRDGGYGIHVQCVDGSKILSMTISDNYIGSSGPAIEQNLRFTAPVAYAFTGKAVVEGFCISKNVYFRTHRMTENVEVHLGKAAAPMPLMWDNKTTGGTDAAASTLATDGKTPIRLHNEEPTAISGMIDGKVITPVLIPSDYTPGQRLILTGDNAKRRVYVPQSSDIYECHEGRFLTPGVFLTLECDGKKFFEVNYSDHRNHHYAEIMDGTVIDADGHATVYVSVPSERRFNAFEGIGHGAQVRLIATTNNVTIVHNDAIQLSAGTDYQMVTNEVKLFFRSRDGVLREE